jgi:hypothetical protein
VKPNTPTNTPKPTFSHQLADEERTMPLGVGDTGGDDLTALDPLAGAGESRRFRSGSMLLIAVVVIACGGLWFMRTLSRVSGISGAKSDIELTIDSYLAPKRPGTGSDPNVLKVLSTSYIERQVPLDSVKSNPFVLPGENEPKHTEVIRGTDPEAVMARARAERQKDIETATERLVVKSIIMSAQPLANISGTIVREGDELVPDGSDVTFRVQSITRDTVTLVVEDLVLGMHVEVPLGMGHAK